MEKKAEMRAMSNIVGIISIGMIALGYVFGHDFGVMYGLGSLNASVLLRSYSR